MSGAWRDASRGFVVRLYFITEVFRSVVIHKNVFRSTVLINTRPFDWLLARLLDEFNVSCMF